MANSTLTFCFALLFFFFYHLVLYIYATFVITLIPRSKWVLLLIKDNIYAKQSKIKEHLLGNLGAKSYFQDMFLSTNARNVVNIS